MKYYQIAELEQLSGIKAHTIRIWEKRYGLIEPDRTNTNIRLYNDDQVRKLLNVSTLLNGGVKISKIAAFTDEEINTQIQKLQNQTNNDVISSSYINDLVASMLEFDEILFEKTFSLAVSKLGMYTAMINVFYPFLNKVGLMWSTDTAMPVQEHFASSIIRRKLMAAIDNQETSVKKKKKFLLMLPEDEWHEIGLLFSHYIIREKGFETIYLGQNVPFQNIKLLVELTKPDFVLSFFVSRKNENVLKNIRQQMGLPSAVTLLVAGNTEVTNHFKSLKNTHVLNSPNDLLKYLS